MNPSSTPSHPKLQGATQWWRDFAAFFQRGNVVDLAVGVMIGAAFGQIVTSFVADVVTPPLGLAMGRIKFTELKWRLGGPPDAPVTLNYGNFLQALLDFTLIAVALFFIISLINRLHRKPAPPASPVSLTRDQELLIEIRDALRRRDQAEKPPA